MPVAKDRQRLSGQGLGQERRDRATVPETHPGPIGIENAYDLGVQLMRPVVRHGNGFGEALGFIVNTARADRIHIPPVRLGLGMDERIPINFRGRGQEKCRFFFFGESESIMRSERADFQSLDRKL